MKFLTLLIICLFALAPLSYSHNVAGENGPSCHVHLPPSYPDDSTTIFCFLRYEDNPNASDDDDECYERAVYYPADWEGDCE